MLTSITNTMHQAQPGATESPSPTDVKEAGPSCQAQPVPRAVRPRRGKSATASHNSSRKQGDENAAFNTPTTSSQDSSITGNSSVKRRRLSSHLDSVFRDLRLTPNGQNPNTTVNTLTFSPDKDEHMEDANAWGSLPADILQLIGSSFPSEASRSFRLVNRHWGTFLPEGALSGSIDLLPDTHDNDQKMELHHVTHPALKTLSILASQEVSTSVMNKSIFALKSFSDLRSLTLTGPPVAPPASPAVFTQHQLFSISHLSHLTSLHISNLAIGGHLEFSYLQRLPLVSLSLNSPIGGLHHAGLESLSTLTSLTHLEFSAQRYVNPSLSPLTTLTNLKHLSAGQLSLTPTSNSVAPSSSILHIQKLAALPYLTKLFLEISNLCDLHIFSELQGIEQLSNIHLSLSFGRLVPTSLHQVLATSEMHLGSRLKSLKFPNPWHVPNGDLVQGELQVAFLPILNQMSGLEQLELSLTSLSPELLQQPAGGVKLEKLTGLRSLRELKVHSMNSTYPVVVSQQAIQSLATHSPELQSLSLHLARWPVAQAALNALHHLSSLTELTLGPPACRRWDNLAGTATLAITQLPAALRSLTASNLVIQPQWVPGNGLLAGPHHLSSLHLTNCHMYDATLTYILSRLAALTSFKLVNVSGLTNASLAAVSTLTTLRSLTVDDNANVMPTTIDLLPACACIPALEELEFRTTDMEASSLNLDDYVCLAAARKLRRLALGLRHADLQEVREILQVDIPRCKFVALPNLWTLKEQAEGAAAVLRQVTAGAMHLF